MTLTLVSFNICPYVLRVAAALYHYNIPFEIKFIDLQNRPDWFLKASPLEKVPILIVRDKVIFESNVILDYIDDLLGHKTLPQDILQKAIVKAKMQFSGEVLTALTGSFWAQTEDTFKEKVADLKWYFEKIEGWLNESKFLGGNELSLIEFAFAPIFTLLNAVKSIYKIDIFEGFPKLKLYNEFIISLPSVQKAMVENYDTIVMERLKADGSYLYK